MSTDSKITRVMPRMGRFNWLHEKERMKNMVTMEEKKEVTVESPSSSTEVEDYFDAYGTADHVYEEWPADYWKVKKLAFYINYGNETLSTAALICLAECNFNSPIIGQTLRNENELNIMLNLVESRRTRVQIAALRCLEKLAQLRNLRYEIVYFGGLQSMISLLWAPSFELRKAVAVTIAKVTVFHRARKIVRQLGGIPMLANLLYAPKEFLSVSIDALTADQKTVLGAAMAGAMALNTLCHDKKNKVEFWKSGALKMCALIVRSNHRKLLIAVIELLKRCADKMYFRTEIRKLGILREILRHLFQNDRVLTQTCAQAVFECAKDMRSREFFGQKGLVEKMYEITSQPKAQEDEDLMTAATGALWKCSKSEFNVKKMHTIGGIPLLLDLLQSRFLVVQIHAVGCLTSCFGYRPCCEVIRKNNGIAVLVNLLNTTHGPLIVNLCKAISEASNDPESMVLIENLNAIEKVWSHLKNTNPWVASWAAWSLCPLLKNIREPAAFVRSLIGGVELVVNLLKSKYTRVSAPACNVVVVMCRNAENVTLLSEYGVVTLFSKMIHTKCKKLRFYLCMAIYCCSPSKNNLKEFGKNGVIKPLLKILTSKTPEVRGAACYALSRLSALPKCCKVICHSKSAQQILLDLLDSDEENVQKCAAMILQNIRLFSLTQEKNFTIYLRQQIRRRRECLLHHNALKKL